LVFTASPQELKLINDTGQPYTTREIRLSRGIFLSKPVLL